MLVSEFSVHFALVCICAMSCMCTLVNLSVARSNTQRILVFSSTSVPSGHTERAPSEVHVEKAYIDKTGVVAATGRVVARGRQVLPVWGPVACGLLAT